MRVLITAASGYVGSLLTSALLGKEYELVGLARDPVRAHQAIELALRRQRADPETLERARAIELVRADVLSGEGLDQALDRVDVAYYLIHSMESGAPAPFPELERAGAQNFVAAARAAGVGRIVYLGGLNTGGQSASAHLSSREQVERILLEGVPESVALRASIVIGAGSRSFRLLVRLVERLPVLALPDWHRYRTQPIDGRDVVKLLIAAARVPQAAGRSLEIGGPDVLSYGEMLERIADLMMVGRPTVRLGLSATPLSARIAAAIAGEDPQLILPLMRGLGRDLLLTGTDGARLLNVDLHSFDAAVEHALGEWEASEPLAAR
ncbi:MAG TPA: NAD(P)H-binding protein [Solirubrobacteraceae bacterium]